MGRGLGDDVEPCTPRSLRGHRPDRDAGRRAARERAEALRRGRRRENDEIGVGELRRTLRDRAIERNDVGPELARQERPRVLGTREEHAARRARQVLEEALLGRASSDQCRLDPVSPHRLGGAGADDRDRRRLTPKRPKKSSAPIRLVSTTQS